MRIVLLQRVSFSPEIDTYRAKFNSEFPNKDMKEEFPGWFGKQIRQRHVDNDPGVSESSELFALACGPSQTPISVNSCVVNGVRFVVHSRDERRTTQNSGICSPGPDGEMYYGQLEQILEFSYLSFKTVLFRVKWFDTSNKGRMKNLVIRNNITQIKANGEAFKNDQYILATQVKQCFYLEDMARRPLGWKVVEHVSHKKFSNGGVIVVEDDPDVIHVDNSSDLALSTSLNDLEIAALHIDGQSIDVDAPPNIIDVIDEEDDIIDEEDPIPHDLANSDDEDLINLDIDDGVNVIWPRGHGGDGGGDDRPPPYQIPTGCGGCLGNRGKGTQKPNLGGRRAGRMHTRQETWNLGLKAITDKNGPVQGIETKKKRNVLAQMEQGITLSPSPSTEVSGSSWAFGVLLAPLPRDPLSDDVSGGSHMLTHGGGCPMTAYHMALLTVQKLQSEPRVLKDKKRQLSGERDQRILEEEFYWWIEDVEPKQIILDPDDQPMWENAKIVAPTPNSAIVQPNVDDSFVINSTHLKMILENKFDGYLLNEELQDIRNKYNELREGNASKNHLNDDTPMCERHEANYIQSEGNKDRNSHDLFSHKSHHDPNDFEKSLTELNNDMKNDLKDFKRRIRSMRTDYDKLYDKDDRKTTSVLPNKESKTVNQEPQSKTDLEKSITKFLIGQRVTNMFFKNNVNDMILKMKQIEKNFQTKIKNMERKIDECSKSQNVSLEQTNWTEPQPPPQAQTE
ncbi:S-adenosyl-L-methionine-dependent methyltransferases superfamily protein [Tanacetum coccineum]